MGVLRDTFPFDSLSAAGWSYRYIYIYIYSYLREFTGTLLPTYGKVREHVRMMAQETE